MAKKLILPKLWHLRLQRELGHIRFLCHRDLHRLNYFVVYDSSVLQCRSKSYGHRATFWLLPGVDNIQLKSQSMNFVFLQEFQVEVLTLSVNFGVALKNMG